jgi:hypothetical protein
MYLPVVLRNAAASTDAIVFVRVEDHVCGAHFDPATGVVE